jgi:uncharacterized protein (DUF2147 family)
MFSDKLKNMNKTAVFLIIVFTSVFAHAQKPVEGVWATGKDNTMVEIRGTDDVLEGKIQASDNPKAEVGTRIIKNLREDDGSYKGELYIIRMQRWVNATFSPKGEKLIVPVSAGFRSKSIEWDRAD